MHGRVKKTGLPALTEQEQEVLREKVRKGRALIDFLLSSKKRHDAASFSQPPEMPEVQQSRKNVMEMSFKLLEFHPEFATIWNYRRSLLEEDMRRIAQCVSSGEGDGETVEQTEPQEKEEEGPHQIEAWLQDELSLLDRALRKAPKSYCVWHHRKWTLNKLTQHYKSSWYTGQRTEHRQSSNAIPVEEDSKLLATALLTRELRLCSEVFRSDDRNFHCWTYRQELLSDLDSDLATRVVTPLLEDIENERREAIGDSMYYPQNVDSCYTEPSEGPLSGRLLIEKLNESHSKALIERNFSNFSAWHLRTKLSFISDEQVKGTIDPKEELEWVRQGIYTEPKDESVWQYYRWLINSKLLKSIPKHIGLITVKVLPLPIPMIALFFGRPTSLDSITNSVQWMPFDTLSTSITGRNVAIDGHPQRISRTRRAFVWVTNFTSNGTFPFLVRDPPKLTPQLASQNRNLNELNPDPPKMKPSEVPAVNQADDVLHLQLRIGQQDNSEPGNEFWDVEQYNENILKVDQSGDKLHRDAMQSDLSLLKHEVGECEQLIDLENGHCKHASLFLHELLLEIERLTERCGCSPSDSPPGEKIEKILTNLIEVDPTRRTLYLDLLERELFARVSITDRSVNLSSKSISRLPPLGHCSWPRFMCVTHLNLSRNNLSSKSFSECGLGLLPNLAFLDLSHNSISSLRPILSFSRQPLLIDISSNPIDGDICSTAEEIYLISKDGQRRIKISHTPLALKQTSELPSYIQDSYEMEPIENRS